MCGVCHLFVKSALQLPTQPSDDAKKGTQLSGVLRMENMRGRLLRALFPGERAQRETPYAMARTMNRRTFLTRAAGLVSAAITQSSSGGTLRATSGEAEVRVTLEPARTL